jgi:hypothetical protein
MSILTKPQVAKGTPAQFTISKSGLLLHPSVAGDSYFSDSQNWYRVNAVYKSAVGSQYEIVEFDASQASPTGTFLVSEKARDSFQIQKLQILDFDGGFLEIPRSSLVSSEWDVVLGQTVVEAIAILTRDFSQGSSSDFTSESFSGAGNNISGGTLNLSGSTNGSTYYFFSPDSTKLDSGKQYKIRLTFAPSFVPTENHGFSLFPSAGTPSFITSTDIVNGYIELFGFSTEYAYSIIYPSSVGQTIVLSSSFTKMEFFEV